MKNALISISILCLILAVVLYFRHSNASKALKTTTTERLAFSNQWEEASSQLTQQKRVGVMLLTNLAARADQLSAVSNQMARLKESVAKAEEATRAARLEIEEREKRIGDWETSHGALAEKANEIRDGLSTANSELAGVKKKLEASEGDRALLLEEIKRVQAERNALAAKFNDVAVVRAQLDKLQNEKVINKRAAWTSSSRVELQQDGSVRLVPLASSTP